MFHLVNCTFKNYWSVVNITASEKVLSAGFFKNPTSPYMRFVKPGHLCSHILWPLVHQVPRWRITARRVICYPFGKLSWTLISPAAYSAPLQPSPTPPFWWIAGRMKASSRSHHQGYGNLGPASGGYLPPISNPEREWEKQKGSGGLCCVEWQWGEGTVQGSSFIGFKSAWQFLTTGVGWDCDYACFTPTMLILLALLSPNFLPAGRCLPS